MNVTVSRAGLFLEEPTKVCLVPSPTAGKQHFVSHVTHVACCFDFHLETPDVKSTAPDKVIVPVVILR